MLRNCGLGPVDPGLTLMSIVSGNSPGREYKGNIKILDS